MSNRFISSFVSVRVLVGLLLCALVVSCGGERSGLLSDSSLTTVVGQSEPEGVACPSDMSITCLPGEEVEMVRNEDGCEAQICVTVDDSSQGSCPIPEIKQCSPGYQQVEGKDPESCVVLQCEKVTGFPASPVPEAPTEKEPPFVCKDKIEQYEVPLGYKRIRHETSLGCFKDRLQANFCNKAMEDGSLSCLRQGKYPSLAFMVPCINGVRRDTVTGKVLSHCEIQSVNHASDAYFDEAYPNETKGCLWFGGRCFDNKPSVSLYHGRIVDFKCPISRYFIDALNDPDHPRRLITFYSLGDQQFICPRLIRK